MLSLTCFQFSKRKSSYNCSFPSSMYFPFIIKNNDALIKKRASHLLQAGLTKGRPAHLSFALFRINVTKSYGKIHQIMTIVQGLLYIFSFSWSIHKVFLTIVMYILINLLLSLFFLIMYKSTKIRQGLCLSPATHNN